MPVTDAQMAPAPDFLKASYSEAGSCLRHYSLCIFNLRVVTVAQGLALVTGSLLLLKEGRLVGAGAVSLLGVLFTLALYAMQRSYWICFDSILNSAVMVERDIVGQLGPWSAYEVAKAKAYGRSWWKILVKHGPYWLFWLAFMVIIVAAIMGRQEGKEAQGEQREINAVVNGQPCASPDG